MSQARCDRLWQAEASLDGRLAPSDRASFDRHAAGCEACRSELEAQRALLEAMRALPAPAGSELAHRRARNALLKAADERLVKRPAARRAWLWWAAPAAGVAAAAAVALAVWAPLPEAQTAPAPQDTAVARYEMVNEGAAQWTEQTLDHVTRVSLTAGTASFHVEHLVSPARFLVALPDGEIEVRGTRFVVAVAGGQTQSVSVTEGVVALSVQGYVGVLHAGETWPPKEAKNEAASGEGSAAPAASVSGATTDPARGTAPAAAPKALPPSSAGARFTEAIAAFSAGDYGRADTLLAAFVRDFPRDARAEDATFLRAQARARRGDEAGAAAVAREYLRAYPKGLRRPEAERLAAGP